MNSFQNVLRSGMRQISNTKWPQKHKWLKQVGSLLTPTSLIGVYFLFDNDELVYIGKTESAVRRFASHQSSKDFTSIVFVKVVPDYLDVVEQALISAFKPRLNIAGTGGEWNESDAMKLLHEAWRKSGKSIAIMA